MMSTPMQVRQLTTIVAGPEGFDDDKIFIPGDSTTTPFHVLNAAEEDTIESRSRDCSSGSVAKQLQSRMSALGSIKQ